MKYGMPYMGSKSSIAPHIIAFIEKRHHDMKHFYDLFGGGGAISHCASTRSKQYTVHYNEIDQSIYSLFKFLQSEECTDLPHELGNKLPDVFYEWINREQFFELIKGDDWLSGLAKVAWSFGNNGQAYMFGKPIENTKRLAHLMVVYKDTGAMEELSKIIEKSLPFSLLFHKTLYQRRIALARHIHDMRVLELEQLQQLRRLERLEQLERLETTNLDYREVSIVKDNSVIYCDPPYENTAEYSTEFDSKTFYQWFRELNVPTYFSSYDAPKDIKCVKQLHKRQKLSPTSKNPAIEKLYWNGVM